MGAKEIKQVNPGGPNYFSGLLQVQQTAQMVG